MPTKTKTARPDRDAVFVCREPVALPDGQVLAGGERRRGDDPLVSDYPHLWQPDGVPLRPPTPDLPPSKAPADAVATDTALYEALPEPLEVVALTRDVAVLHKNQVHRFECGAVFARDCELHRALPDAFERVKR